MFKNIQSTEKEFLIHNKSYSNSSEAWNEAATNAFFAPAVKHIKWCFKSGSDGYFYCQNDGEPMSQELINNAIGYYGCESANTAGNENGMGLKCLASYVTQYHDDSIVVIASKRNGAMIGFGIINKKGQYSNNYEDLTSNQKDCIKSILGTFIYGTVTIAYHTKLEPNEITSFKNQMYNMFSTGLKKVQITFNIDDKEINIDYIDRYYTNLKYIEHYENKVSFEYDRKVYKCKLIAVDTRHIKPEDYNPLDAIKEGVYHDFGLHLGYDNGYVPICLPKVEILGFLSKPQYYYARMCVIAYPIDNSEKYANTNDWKKFYSKIANVNPQKVANLNKPINYFYGSGKKENDLKPATKEFYNGVIFPLKELYNKWLPKEDKEAKNSEDAINELNTSLKKSVLVWCDNSYNFQFSKNIETPCKYDKNNKTVYIKHGTENPLYQKLKRGGRNGRNGDNDMDIIIQPTLDFFKMEIKECNTTTKIDNVINKLVNRFNHYYLEDVRK